jgi:hypothetical protein
MVAMSKERQFTWHEAMSGWEAARIGYEKQLAKAAKASAAPSSSEPAPYNYNTQDDWKRFVCPDGSIRSTPRGRWEP